MTKAELIPGFWTAVSVNGVASESLPEHVMLKTSIYDGNLGINRSLIENYSISENLISPLDVNDSTDSYIKEMLELTAIT